ncbi:hypothetical protein BT69DRAFT_1329913 [Atractiella rhizophila]|nr:hypothetical protein BT69DRAFT_1329913 [Atractiella rhizophila]
MVHSRWSEDEGINEGETHNPHVRTSVDLPSYDVQQTSLPTLSTKTKRNEEDGLSSSMEDEGTIMNTEKRSPDPYYNDVSGSGQSDSEEEEEEETDDGEIEIDSERRRRQTVENDEPCCCKLRMTSRDQSTTTL